MRTLILSLAIVAALGAVPAMADPNEPDCKGQSCPKEDDKGGR